MKIKDIINLFVALITLFGFGFFLFKLSELVFENIEKVNPNILVAIIGSTVTIIGYFISRYLEKKKLIEQQIREQKLPVYDEFVEFLFKILKDNKSNKKLSEKELIDLFYSLNKKSILWLSDNSLKAYKEWRIKTINLSDNNSENAGVEVMALLEKMLFEFRKDIGHKNQNLKSGDILSLFINDWYEYSKKQL
ncbi:hypothetical protein [uncultured Flavobacterium sp.]|uniref:hypothetical protein n=1 Tax=uncultured Flavobacterium sp. TaxID=165435 RepID=UPI00261052F8|nr:hypothetical protein [uncultured Flavobacterium sp.]